MPRPASATARVPEACAAVRCKHTFDAALAEAFGILQRKRLAEIVANEGTRRFRAPGVMPSQKPMNDEPQQRHPVFRHDPSRHATTTPQADLGGMARAGHGALPSSADFADAEKADHRDQKVDAGSMSVEHRRSCAQKMHRHGVNADASPTAGPGHRNDGLVTWLPAEATERAESKQIDRKNSGVAQITRKRRKSSAARNVIMRHATMNREGGREGGVSVRCMQAEQSDRPSEGGGDRP